MPPRYHPREFMLAPQQFGEDPDTTWRQGPGVKPRTFRLPSQPEVVLRELGPRSFEHIPARELATLMAALAVEHGWDHEEALWRAILDTLGLKRLTTNVTARLTDVMPLARQIAATEALPGE
jgi:hypothetical protein